MIIRTIRATPVNIPLRAPYRFSYGSTGSLTKTVIELLTEDGVTGLGECADGDRAADVAALAERLVGRDLRDIGPARQACVPGMGYTPWGNVTAARRVFAGIEMAMWDARGKTEGQPLHRLLGGAVRTEIPLTEYFSYRLPGADEPGEASPADIARYCARMMEDTCLLICGRTTLRTVLASPISSGLSYLNGGAVGAWNPGGVTATPSLTHDASGAVAACGPAAACSTICSTSDGAVTMIGFEAGTSPPSPMVTAFSLRVTPFSSFAFSLKRIPVMAAIVEMTLGAEAARVQVPRPGRFAGAQTDIRAVLADEGITPAYLQGYLTAVVIAPREPPPEAWLVPLVGGIEFPGDGTLDRVLDLVRSELEQLDRTTGEPQGNAARIAALDDEDLCDWADGFDDLVEATPGSWPARRLAAEDKRVLRAIAEIADGGTGGTLRAILPAWLAQRHARRG